MPTPHLHGATARQCGVLGAAHVAANGTPPRSGFGPGWGFRGSPEPAIRPIKRQGFQGRYGMVALYVRRLRQVQGLAPRQCRSDQPLTAVTAGTPPPPPPPPAAWVGLPPPPPRTPGDDHLFARRF